MIPKKVFHSCKPSPSIIIGIPNLPEQNGNEFLLEVILTVSSLNGTDRTVRFISCSKERIGSHCWQFSSQRNM